MNIRKLLFPLTALSILMVPARTHAEPPLQPSVVASPQQSAQEEELKASAFTLAVMKAVKSPLSGPRRLKVAKSIAKIAVKIFESPERRLDWIILLGMESRFMQRSASARGAIGIGQIMPRFAKGFARLCGMPKFQNSQLLDLEVNAELSACVFNQLYRDMDSTSLALVAYNAGPNSRDLRSIQELGNVNTETANYITRFSYLREMIKANLARNSFATLYSL